MTVPKLISARCNRLRARTKIESVPRAQGHQGGWVASSGGVELVDAAQLLNESGVV